MLINTIEELILQIWGPRILTEEKGNYDSRNNILQRNHHNEQTQKVRTLASGAFTLVIEKRDGDEKI